MCTLALMGMLTFHCCRDLARLEKELERVRAEIDLPREEAKEELRCVTCFGGHVVCFFRLDGSGLWGVLPCRFLTLPFCNRKLLPSVKENEDKLASLE